MRQIWSPTFVPAFVHANSVSADASVTNTSAVIIHTTTTTTSLLYVLLLLLRTVLAYIGNLLE